MPDPSWNPLPRLGLAVLPLACLLAVSGSAHALSMKECSAKYQQAKQAGTLNGSDWRTFRTTQCAADATPAQGTAATPTAAQTTPPQTTPPTAAPPPLAAAPSAGAGPTAGATSPAPATRTTRAAPSGSATSAPTAAGPAVFPSAVAPKYASEKAGQARLHTCLDQYKANKAANANGGMHWIQKGGGYYSECSKHLKG